MSLSSVCPPFPAMTEPIKPYAYPVVRPISQTQLVSELEHLLRVARLDHNPYTVWIGGALDSVHANNPRRYAQVGAEDRVFEFATATLQLPYCHRRGLLAHEVGHVIAPDASEDETDAAAARVLGIEIAYDGRWPGKGLQFAVNCR